MHGPIHHETQQRWCLSGPPETRKKNKYVTLKWTLLCRSIVIAVLVNALPITIAEETLPEHKSPDTYTLALHEALLFFNAQKSGKLPKDNGIPWRGDSGMNDGKGVAKGGLVGGYYDAGDNTKVHFPMAFAMTMLSWSLIEYNHKYKAIGEYDHIRELIKWGTDYLLLTFNSSATKIDHIDAQVGGALTGSSIPDDHYCWQRPEDMDYPRPVQTITSGPDLAGEMAAALAAASIVLRDNAPYSKKLIRVAKTVFAFARDFSRIRRFSRGNPYIEPYYDSTGYYDEYMWGAAWLYYATGNVSYIKLATTPGLARNAKAFSGNPDLGVLSWDNKSPAAMLLLTRLWIFLNPGYPYEDMLMMYRNATTITMCSYLKVFRTFNWTRGTLLFNHMRIRGNDSTEPWKAISLPCVANAAFLASLFVDYLNAAVAPGFYWGPNFIFSNVLQRFATSQMDYILGKNPKKMSYVVGYGNNFPRQVHHKGASIPHDKKKYSCTEGWKWRDSRNPNPNNSTGAMVPGPDQFEQLHDVRSNLNYTEASLAGNAGLAPALVSLMSSGGHGIDVNTMFSALPPLFPDYPPAPAPAPWMP